MTAMAPNLGVDPGTQPNGAPAAPSWYPESERGYVESKGWKGPEDLYKSYRELERIQRTPRDRILELPEKYDDSDSLGKFLEALHERTGGRIGRPAKPEGYEATDIDPALAQLLYNAGMSKRQVTEIRAGLEARSKAEKEAADTKYNQESQIAQAELRREWGAEYDRNVGLAQQIVQKMYNSIGYERAEALQEDLSKIENQLGHRRFMKMFAFLGRGLAEAPFVDGGSAERSEPAQGFGMTPDAAMVEFKRLAQDPAFMESVHKGDASAMEKFDRLAKLAAPRFNAGGPQR